MFFIRNIRSAVKLFLANNCAMHSAGLTYFTLLAVIPMLCCMLVVAKACGVDRVARDQINARIDSLITSVEKGQEDALAKIAAPLDGKCEEKRIAAQYFAKQAREVSNSVFERIENFDVETFGWIGFSLLLWTLVSSLGMVEASFNGISGIAKPRPIWKRLYAYAFVMVILPVLATVAMSVPVLKIAKDIVIATAGSLWLTKWVSAGLVCIIDALVFRMLLSVAFASLLFAFFFWAMPNCRMNLKQSFSGGVFTAVFFALWLKFCAVAQVGISRSSALYGSFAFFPIVLTWVYISWEIVLFGFCFARSFDAEISAAKEEE